MMCSRNITFLLQKNITLYEFTIQNTCGGAKICSSLPLTKKQNLKRMRC